MSEARAVQMNALPRLLRDAKALHVQLRKVAS